MLTKLFLFRKFEIVLCIASAYEIHCFATIIEAHSNHQNVLFFSVQGIGIQHNQQSNSS